MKKLISIFLTLSFLLCLFPTVLSVSAAETELNRAGTKWTVCRADPLFVVDDTNDYEFTWKADSTGNTYDWPVYRAESLDAGTIETTIGGIGNGGIFFGATGIKEYVGDSHEKIPGTNESKVGLGDVNKDIRYYYAAVVWEKHNNGNYKFRLYYDNAADNGTMNTYTGVALNESAHGVNGTSDVKIKVEFDKAGNLNCYVNDVRVMTRTDCQPFGDQFGIIARKSNYGSSKALTNINSVKEFEYETPLNNANTNWTACRSAALFRKKGTDTNEFYWKSDANKMTWDWPVYRKETLEEGTIEATISASANAGIIFGATGIKEYVGEASENKVSLGDTNKDIRFYWAAVIYEEGIPKFRLYYDDSAVGAYNSKPSVILNESVHGITGASDIKLKVVFDKAGNCSCYVNGVKVYSGSDIVPFGNQFGIGVRKMGYTVASAEVGSVKSFSFSSQTTTEAPETGDYHIVYGMIALIAVISLAAVICIKRRKSYEKI